MWGWGGGGAVKKGWERRGGEEGAGVERGWEGGEEREGAEGRGGTRWRSGEDSGGTECVVERDVV